MNFLGKLLDVSGNSAEILNRDGVGLYPAGSTMRKPPLQTIALDPISKNVVSSFSAAFPPLFVCQSRIQPYSLTPKRNSFSLLSSSLPFCSAPFFSSFLLAEAAKERRPWPTTRKASKYKLLHFYADSGHKKAARENPGAQGPPWARGPGLAGSGRPPESRVLRAVTFRVAAHMVCAGRRRGAACRHATRHTRHPMNGTPLPGARGHFRHPGGPQSPFLPSFVPLESSP